MAAEGTGHLSLTEARRKCEEKYSCFTKIECTECMSLSPSYIGRLKEGIEEELSKKLMKFCEKLQGVIVAYDKIQLLRRHGSIVEESPFIHFEVKVNYIVFQPQVDSKLIGVVNKFGYDHIGCLVHGCFNASISNPRTQNGHFTDNLKLGSSFTFRVVGLESLNGVLLITGAFDDKTLRKKSKSKKSLDRDKNSDPTTEGTEIQTSKKSKKHKQENDSETEGPVAKKKKKLSNGDARRDEEVSANKNNNNEKNFKIKSEKTSNDDHISSLKKAKKKKKNHNL
ncbi:DNA-directed RNA polymerase I subunit RPA43-like [Actinia tenebrosa]|uniref:DNA-directed RNA polymerase I subunit RPA43 n=1 Tax=Actinia tenebrosa TaxID=6105 RepID=A0A6P8IBY8_ACTTE|nr:DNA-directed RNA polymerase I subunit RPA43-like [Actinia tenebrosa]